MKGLRVEIVVRREGAPVEEAIAQPVEDVATVLARAGHESGGPRTPRGGASSSILGDPTASVSSELAGFAGFDGLPDGRRQPVAGFRQALRRVVHVACGRRHAVDAGQAGAVLGRDGFCQPALTAPVWSFVPLDVRGRVGSPIALRSSLHSHGPGSPRRCADARAASRTGRVM